MSKAAAAEQQIWASEWAFRHRQWHYGTKLKNRAAAGDAQRGFIRDRVTVESRPTRSKASRLPKQTT